MDRERHPDQTEMDFRHATEVPLADLLNDFEDELDHEDEES